MKIAFRLSKMGFGGAERVFLSVANQLAAAYDAQICFVVDNVGTGETERLITKHGHKLVGLKSHSTLQSILPLRGYLNREKPDILLSAYTDTNLGAIISSKLAKHPCKVIVSEHASLKEHWQYASFKRRFLLRHYVKFGYHFSHHILTVSKGIASQVISVGHKPEKVSYIHNPVRFDEKNMMQRENVNKKDTPVILAVGRICKQKDYLTLLKAFKLLHQSMTSKLVIVGGVHEDAEKAKLDDYIHSHNLTGLIEFAGFTESVQDYYAQADVFVLSSAWEGFGNVIVEALAFGLPVVSTNCNYGPAEILADGEYGKLVPVGDSQRMAEAIEAVLSHQPFISADQVRRAKDFSEIKIGEAYFELFQKVLKAS